MSKLAFYQNNIQLLSIEKSKLTKKLSFFRGVRLFVFLISLIGIYISFGNALLFVGVLLFFVSIFLWIIAKYTNVKNALELVVCEIQLNQNELEALQGNFSSFSHGGKYEDSKHAFSGDLDLFKPKGVFSFLNRTTSDLGEAKLAEMLLNGNENTSEVNEITNAISKEIIWAIHFRAVGLLNAREKGRSQSLNDIPWGNFTSKTWFNSVQYVVPFIAWTSLILCCFDMISNALFSAIAVFTLLPSSLELKNTNRIASQITDKEERLVIVRDQLKMLDELALKNEQNVEWINKLFDASPKEISKEINDLIKIIGRFNTRNNVLLGLIFNLFLSWDIRQRISLNKWKNLNQNKLINWEVSLAKIEAYVSVSFIRFNYPNTIFANHNNDKCITMKGLIHPLLAHQDSVSNDFLLEDKKQFMILTGPNMAGKSTYLRAVGCAIIFANAGFPVFASNFSCDRLTLFTSMRTVDNLSESSSYFFAELSRLRVIMDAVEQNKDVFVLLDEILKGTNSKDKEEGSYLFMEKMQVLGSRGIIATHDLSLCKLELENQAFYTAHFDSIINENELSFDYQLKRGICQNMNASFLLKKMNLTH